MIRHNFINFGRGGFLKVIPEMVVMNSNCKRHLNALGIKQTIQADEYGFL